MVMLILPFSPLPAGMTRDKLWNDNNNVYDSGDQQGFTNWQRPLYQYSIPIKNYTEIKQSSLWAFWDRVRGKTDPWLIKDPYDNAVNSVLGAGSGVLSAATLFLFDTNSYFVRADTTTIASLFSSKSGFVKIGSNYQYDRDTGLFTVTSKAIDDVWSVRSMSYFKKVRFSGAMTEQAIMWNTFGTTLSIMELP